MSVFEWWSQYLAWIRENPDKATDVENGLKWVSYIGSCKL